MKWIKKSWKRLESEPRRFFIRKSTTKGQRRVRLFEYDNSPNGYHAVAYCSGLREAKNYAESLIVPDPPLWTREPIDLEA